MGIFRKDPMERLILERSKRLEKIFEDGCEYWGIAVMIARPTDVSATTVDNLRSMTAKYYLKNDGSIYLRAETSFDEFVSPDITNWSYGFNGEHTNKIFFNCILFPWIFIIEKETEGNCEDWFNKHYKENKTNMKSIFPL
jgi:hypothetical protein